jgi:hypothetical protein
VSSKDLCENLVDYLPLGVVITSSHDKPKSEHTTTRLLGLEILVTQKVALGVLLQHSIHHPFLWDFQCLKGIGYLFG